MKVILIILLVTHVSLAQKDDHTKTSVDFILMSKVLNNPKFSDDLNTSSSFQFGKPINYIGISLTSGFIVNERSRTDGGYPLNGYFEYLQIIPQQMHVNDSVEMQINGFNLGITLLGFDLLRNEKYDLITCIGFNTGRVWLKDNDQFKQKNPYFSPMIAIIPRLIIGKISLQLRCSYDYDISNKNWKRKGQSTTELLTLNKFSYQGLNFSFGLGYIIE